MDERLLLLIGFATGTFLSPLTRNIIVAGKNFLGSLGDFIENKKAESGNGEAK